MTLPAGLVATPRGAVAVVIGASGAIGAALLERLESDAAFAHAVGFSRSGAPHLDLADEATIAEAAGRVSRLGAPIRIVIDATGVLHGAGMAPEKGLRQLEAANMAKSFAVNAIGPALLMKHFLPLLPRQGKAVFATLSAKVGSIGDNRLGGWYSYRASKAALNQLVCTAAIELKRSHPQAACIALHPGTVDSRLSAPFMKAGLEVRQPPEAAGLLLKVIDGISAADSGAFLDCHGARLPW